jgi:anti-sigma factor RsiW
MNGKTETGDADLHAYIDGALDAEHAARVGAAIRRDPTLTANVIGFRTDKDMLKKIYGPIAAQPVPAQWLTLVQHRHARPAISWRQVGAIAALLLVAVTAIFGYRMLTSPGQPGEIVQAAIDARQGSGGQTFTITEGAEAPDYNRMISNAVAMRVKVPSLEKLGYQLAGIRLYKAAPGGGAAELLYRDKADRLFTLYLRRSDGAARFDQFERAGLRVCIWQDDQLGMVMAGNVSTAAMQRLASLAYTGLTS